MDRLKSRTVDYNSPTDWMVGLKRGEIVVGRAISSEIFDHIGHIFPCGPETSLEIRGSGIFALKIKNVSRDWVLR